MASPNVNMIVSVEQTVHSTIADVVQKIYDQYNIEISHITVVFINTSVHGKANRFVRRVEIQSTTEHA